MELLMKSFKDFIKEDGAGGMTAGPTSTVAGVAGTGDSRMPAPQREPGVNKKHNPIMGGIRRRRLPQM